jgi:hypothetical protein
MSQNFIKRYYEAGFSFFNTGSREKKIFTRWQCFQKRKPTLSEVKSWLQLPIQNYGIVTGEISNLVVFDVDTKNDGDPTPFLNRGLFEIRTPSGGYHFYTTYNPLLESTKHKKAKKDGILKAVDVQSNGALVFAPPTTFPNGTYTITNDVPIGPLPDDLLAKVLEALKPEEKATDYTPYIQPKNVEGKRPGDIFNVMASWDDVLIPLGWRKVHQTSSQTTYWCRPGKRDGISASTNHKGYDLFFCFSESVPELTTRKGYTKFSLLTALKYGGDPRAAAKSLVVDNYKIVNNLIN